MGYRSGLFAMRWLCDSPAAIHFILAQLRAHHARGEKVGVYLTICDERSPIASPETLNVVITFLKEFSAMVGHPYVVLAQKGFVAAATRAGFATVSLATKGTWDVVASSEEVIWRHSDLLGEPPAVLYQWLRDSGLAEGTGDAYEAP